MKRISTAMFASIRNLQPPAIDADFNQEVSSLL